MRRIYTYQHYKDTTVLDYQKSIINNINVVEGNGGTFGVKKGVVDMSLVSQSPTHRDVGRYQGGNYSVPSNHQRVITVMRLHHGGRQGKIW